MDEEDWVTKVARQLSGEEPLTEEEEVAREVAARARAVEFMNSEVRKDEVVVDESRWINRVAGQLIEDIEGARLRSYAPQYYKD